jgi:hypothetical protein
VIRHYDKSGEAVQGPDIFATANSLHDAFGDSRLFEPGGPERCAIQFAVGCDERASVAAGSQVERPVQPEGDEQRFSVGLIVGKVAAVFQMFLVLRPPKSSRHFEEFSQAKACATLFSRAKACATL